MPPIYTMGAGISSAPIPEKMVLFRYGPDTGTGQFCTLGTTGTSIPDSDTSSVLLAYRYPQIRYVRYVSNILVPDTSGSSIRSPKYISGTDKPSTLHRWYRYLLGTGLDTHHNSFVIL